MPPAEVQCQNHKTAHVVKLLEEVRGSGHPGLCAEDGVPLHQRAQAALQQEAQPYTWGLHQILCESSPAALGIRGQNKACNWRC